MKSWEIVTIWKNCFFPCFYRFAAHFAVALLRFYSFNFRFNLHCYKQGSCFCVSADGHRPSKRNDNNVDHSSPGTISNPPLPPPDFVSALPNIASSSSHTAVPIRHINKSRLSPLAFSAAVVGRNICLSPDCTVAVRRVEDYCNAYVFTPRPMHIHETVVIQVTVDLVTHNSCLTPVTINIRIAGLIAKCKQCAIHRLMHRQCKQKYSWIWWILPSYCCSCSYCYLLLSWPLLWFR